jgi:hypothetical protein
MAAACRDKYRPPLRQWETVPSTNEGRQGNRILAGEKVEHA